MCAHPRARVPERERQRVCLIRILLGIVWLAREVREREREKRERPIYQIWIT